MIHYITEDERRRKATLAYLNKKAEERQDRQERQNTIAFGVFLATCMAVMIWYAWNFDEIAAALIF